MASGFFAVLDDISALLDDVATMTKIAGKKTAAILGDDLAVNAEKATGFVSNRELPILWAITKGSFLNKIIILPIAFLLSAFVPIAITIILLLGGMYLAYEGVEKIIESVLPHSNAHKNTTNTSEKIDLAALEKSKIKAAILTDFILSIEIIIVALGTVMNEPILEQILVVTFIALLATVGVYGIVALIVRMDDFGQRLIDLNSETDSLSDRIGRLLIYGLPWIIKFLAVIGTIALLLVSGGIFNHNIDTLHHLFPSLPSFVKDFLTGFIVGTIVWLLVTGIKKLTKH